MVRAPGLVGPRDPVRPPRDRPVRPGPRGADARGADGRSPGRDGRSLRRVVPRSSPTFEAASMAMVYAATYPERVAALALYNPVAKGSAVARLPLGQLVGGVGRADRQIHARWGTREYAAEFLRAMAPTAADDPEMVEWIARVHRLGASPGAAEVILRMAMTVDVRDVLPSIRVPTLVLYRDFVPRRSRVRRRACPERPRRRDRRSRHDVLAGRGARGRDRRVLQRRHGGAGAGHRARDDPVHGHRRLDAHGQSSSATEPGRISSSVTTRSSARSSTASAAASWTPRATGSSRRSTGRFAPSVAQPRSKARCAISAST